MPATQFASLKEHLAKLAESLLLLDAGEAGTIMGFLPDLEGMIAHLPRQAPDGLRDALSESYELLAELAMVDEEGFAGSHSDLMTALSQAQQAAHQAARDTAILDDAPDPGDVADFLVGQGMLLDTLSDLVSAVCLSGTDEEKAELTRLIRAMGQEAGTLGLRPVQYLCEGLTDGLERSEPSQLTDSLNQAVEWLRSAFSAYASDRIPAPPDRLLHSIYETIQSLEGSSVLDEPVLVSGGDVEGVETMEFGGSTANPEPHHAPEPVQAAQPTQPAASTAAAAQPTPSDEPLFPLTLLDDPELLSDYIEEATEHLEASDQSLLDLEADPNDNTAFDTTLRALHTIKGMSGLLGIRAVESLTHEGEHLLHVARQDNVPPSPAALQALFRTIDMVRIMVGDIAEGMTTGRSGSRPPGLTELAEAIHRLSHGGDGAEFERQPSGLGAVASDAPAPAPAAAPPLPAVAIAETDAAERQPAPSVTPTAAPSPSQTPAAAEAEDKSRGQATEMRESLRVDAARLDHLGEAVGELVVATAGIHQAHEHGDRASIDAALSQLNKLTRELQEIATSLRMVPVKTTFKRMARVVRDTARKTGKPVELHLIGEDTELDKNVVDRLADPLLHMVRNAIDHGVEPTTEARIAAGKPPVASLQLSARHSGGHIYVQIADDGRGINREAVLARAIERGLVRPDAELTPRQINNLIFEPGFSTATEVTDLSGRGVGMDVVRTTISALNGTLEVESEPGVGTIITLCMPLTLAIIEAMQVRAGGEQYLIPTLAVRRLSRAGEGTVTRLVGSDEVLRDQNELLPIVDLARTMGLARRDSGVGVYILVHSEQARFALLVDEIIGQQQVVIKTLGEAFSELPGVSGSAIMPDGRVSLIVDIDGIQKLAATTSPPKALEQRL